MENYDINYDAKVDQEPRKLYMNVWPRSIPLNDAQLEAALEATTECETEKVTTTTECVSPKPKGPNEEVGDSNKEVPATASPPTEATHSVSPLPKEATPETATSSTEAPATTLAAAPAAATVATTTAAPAATTAPPPGSAPGTQPPPSGAESVEVEPKTKELHQLVQHLYIAQARVQLEATEIKKAQALANSAQQQLEEAATHVRTITASLQNAQQEVASAAIRAQTAQLQLAAHDQLLFAARQDVDALSSQMVGIQAAEGFTQPKVQFDLGGLLERLKQPLQDNEKPTAVPPLVSPPIKASTATVLFGNYE